MGGRARQTFDAHRGIADQARAHRREERDTWLLLAMLHSSLLEPLADTDEVAPCPQTADEAAQNLQLGSLGVDLEEMHAGASRFLERVVQRHNSDSVVGMW